MNKPQSQLQKMWTRDSIAEWSIELGEPVPTYVPSANVVTLSSNVSLPGDKCIKCKKLRAKRPSAIGVNFFAWSNSMLYISKNGVLGVLRVVFFGSVNLA